MVTMKKSVGEKILCKRINEFFYQDESGAIQKYSQYCIEKKI